MKHNFSDAEKALLTTRVYVYKDGSHARYPVWSKRLGRYGKASTLNEALAAAKKVGEPGIDYDHFDPDKHWVPPRPRRSGFSLANVPHGTLSSMQRRSSSGSTGSYVSTDSNESMETTTSSASSVLSSFSLHSAKSHVPRALRATLQRMEASINANTNRVGNKTEAGFETLGRKTDAGFETLGKMTDGISKNLTAFRAEAAANWQAELRQRIKDRAEAAIDAADKAAAKAADKAAKAAEDMAQLELEEQRHAELYRAVTTAAPVPVQSGVSAPPPSVGELSIEELRAELAKRELPAVGSHTPAGTEPPPPPAAQPPMPSMPSSPAKAGPSRPSRLSMNSFIQAAMELTPRRKKALADTLGIRPLSPPSPAMSRPIPSASGAAEAEEVAGAAMAEDDAASHLTSPELLALSPEGETNWLTPGRDTHRHLASLRAKKCAPAVPVDVTDSAAPPVPRSALKRVVDKAVTKGKVVFDIIRSPSGHASSGGGAKGAKTPAATDGNLAAPPTTPNPRTPSRTPSRLSGGSAIKKQLPPQLRALADDGEEVRRGKAAFVKACGMYMTQGGKKPDALEEYDWSAEATFVRAMPGRLAACASADELGMTSSAKLTSIVSNVYQHALNGRSAHLDEAVKSLPDSLRIFREVGVDTSPLVASLVPTLVHRMNGGGDDASIAARGKAAECFIDLIKLVPSDPSAVLIVVIGKELTKARKAAPKSLVTPAFQENDSRTRRAFANGVLAYAACAANTMSDEGGAKRLKAVQKTLVEMLNSTSTLGETKSEEIGCALRAIAMLDAAGGNNFKAITLNAISSAATRHVNAYMNMKAAA